MIEVVGGLVEEQEVVVGPKQAGEAHPVALTDGEFGEGPCLVGLGVEGLESDEHAPFGAPGVERLGDLEGRRVALLGTGVFAGERRTCPV